MLINQVMAAANWCALSGSVYYWDCFGPNVRILTFEKNQTDGSAPVYNDNEVADVVYSTTTGQVYKLSVYNQPKFDGDENTWAYTWIDPEVKNQYIAECRQRNVVPFVVWESFVAALVETEDDILQKLHDQVNMRKVDHCIQVPLKLSDKEWYSLMRMAHEKDITLNQLVENTLTKHLMNKEVK